MKTLFIADMQSMTFAAKKKFQKKFNVHKLYSYIATELGGEPDRSIAYGVKICDEFLSKLKSAGFELNYVDPVPARDKLIYPSRAVSICTDVARIHNRFDRIVLGTSDVQFVDLVKFIKDMGHACHVVSPIVPKQLREVSSKWFELDEEVLRAAYSSNSEPVPVPASDITF